MNNTNLPVWNPFQKGYLENPHEKLRHLRERNPVHKGINNRWMLFRYDDVKSMLLNPTLKTIEMHEQISSKNQFLVEPENFDDLSTAVTKWLFFMNAPDHPVVRQLVMKLWNQYNVQNYIEQVVREATENIHSKSCVEIVADFADIIPIKIICLILGLPFDNFRQLKQWGHYFSQMVEPFESLENLLICDKNAQEFYEYLETVVEVKKSAPDDSFISNFLIGNESEGNPLSREELISVFLILYFAGTETSIYLIGQSVLHLIRHPAQLKLLREDLSLTRQAVEELIRFSSPVQYTPRVAARDLKIRNRLVREGEIVTGCIASANRDPEIFKNPEEIDFTRKSNPHLSFGHGLHHCIGAKLARDEMNTLLPVLLKHFSNIEFDGVNPFEWNTNIINRGLKHLHVALN